LPLAGCLSADQRKSAAASNSLFALLAPESPAQVAADMVDQFDAQKRYRGTLLISSAPWGGEDVYVRTYENALRTDPDEGVRSVAALALGRHGSSVHAPLVLPLLESTDPRIRYDAARVLQRLHNPQVVQALISRTTAKVETSKDVRAAAANALGQYPQKPALDALIAALDDDELLVARTARESLRTLTGTDQSQSARAWRTWTNATANPFAGQRAYVFPAFNRDKYFWERLPLIPDPPNEAAANPAGFSLGN
jgi:hypothetical protein